MHMSCVNKQEVYGIEAVREAQTAAEARKRHLESDDHPYSALFNGYLNKQYQCT